MYLIEADNDIMTKSELLKFDNKSQQNMTIVQ